MVVAGKPDGVVLGRVPIIFQMWLRAVVLIPSSFLIGTAGTILRVLGQGVRGNGWAGGGVSVNDVWCDLRGTRNYCQCCGNGAPDRVVATAGGSLAG